MQIGQFIFRTLAFTRRQVFIEARVGRWWYVFYWHRDPCKPWRGLEAKCDAVLYRSTDGTPPRGKGHGTVVFGDPAGLP